MENLLTAKIISVGVLFTVSTFFGLFPFLVARSKLFQKCFKPKTILSILNIFQGLAGGVILSGALLHILPESNSLITNGIKLWSANTTATDAHDHDHNETVPHRLVGLAVKVISAVSEDDHDGHDEHDHQLSIATLIMGASLIFIFLTERIIALFFLNTHHDHHGHSADTEEGENKKNPKNKKEQKVVEEIEEKKINEKSNLETGESAVNLDKIVEKPTDTALGAEKIEKSEKHEHNHFKDRIAFMISGNKKKLFSGIILWLSLLLHSVLEGIGAGAVKSDSQFWSLFIFIVIHEYIVSFSLGVILNETIQSIWIAIPFIVSFTMAGPFGIAVGTAISLIQFATFDLISGIALSAAAGAFLHVSLFEILAEEENSSTPKFFIFLKYVFFVIGFSAMSVVVNFI